MNNETQVEQPTQKSKDLVLSHKISLIFIFQAVAFLVIILIQPPWFSKLPNACFGLLQLAVGIGLIWFLFLLPFALMQALITGVEQICNTNVEARTHSRNIFQGFRICLAYISLVAYLVFAIPHFVASIYLEDTWQRWVETKDSIEFQNRDNILEELDFDTETSFRFWKESNTALPGLYIPNRVLRLFGMSDK